MCVCVWLCVCARVYVRVCVYVYRCVYVYVFMCMCVNVLEKGIWVPLPPTCRAPQWTGSSTRCTGSLASYPGLLAPAFVACSSINAGKGLVKLSHVVWHTWMCGGVAYSFCTAVKRLSESKKHRQDCLMSSAQSFYSPFLQSVVHLLTCCFPGMCHSSTLIILCETITSGGVRECVR